MIIDNIMPSKKSQKGSSNTKLSPISMTFDCLHHWYDSVFEKFAWYVVDYIRHQTAEEFKNIESYMNEIEELRSSIELHKKYTHDKDKRNDLQIMGENTDILLSHAKDDFKPKF